MYQKKKEANNMRVKRENLKEYYSGTQSRFIVNYEGSRKTKEYKKYNYL